MSTESRLLVPAAAICISLIAAGCLSTTEVPDTLFWEGAFVLEADAPAGMTGASAMVSLAAQTQIGVGLSGAPADATFGWLVRRGRCLSPGIAEAPPSVFPALDVSNSGAIEAEAVIQRRLTGTEYAVQVVENADGTGDVLACANLMRT
jgi:hypothetical protein